VGGPGQGGRPPARHGHRPPPHRGRSPAQHPPGPDVPTGDGAGPLGVDPISVPQDGLLEGLGVRPTSSSSYAAPRWTSPRLAAEGNLASSTVCAVLLRLGLNRLCRPEPPEPP